MQIEKLNIQNSTSNDFNPIIINNILASLNKPTCLTYPLKLKYPPCEIYWKKRVGGQLIALALTVAETAYDLATGVISWAQAGINESQIFKTLERLKLRPGNNPCSTSP